MPISKASISSPLEAGASLLESNKLPASLTAALEYVSARLARKRLHLSLIVVRKDVQVPTPTAPERCISPAGSIFSTTSSTPSRSLCQSPSNSSISDSSSISSSSSASSTLSRTQWSSLPSSPRDFNATIRTSPPIPKSPNPFGISLIHACTLTSKAEKVLRQTIAKAEKKFPIGTGWLSSKPLTATITCPTTNDLLRNSLKQNEVVFSSEGLTLFSLDHFYTFKCQLNTYSRSLSASDLTTAVDELRRLVLAQNGQKITKAYLTLSYEFLGTSLASLVDVNEGYKTAYGGKDRLGGIEVQEETRANPLALKTNFATSELRQMKLSIAYSDDDEITPTPYSTCRTYSSASSCCSAERDSFVEFGESAKGRNSSAFTFAEEALREDRGPHMRGPMTPNGFEDITPVTKGEWGFLTTGEGWGLGRTAPVETC